MSIIAQPTIDCHCHVIFNAPFNGTEFYVRTGDLPRKLADLDMLLQIQVKEDQLLEFMPLIERLDVRLIMDHCGRPAPRRPAMRAWCSCA